MSDEDPKVDASSGPTVTDPQKQTADEILNQARKFLATKEISNASWEKKASFLKLKGLSDGDIEKLLGEQETTTQVSDKDEKANSIWEASQSPSSPSSQPQPQPPTPSQPPTQTFSSMPPIVTYPEFLIKAARPPPLVTVSRLLNTVSASALTGATLYGTAKFFINPRVEAVTAARRSLYKTTDDRLVELVAKLEKVVSVVPPRIKRGTGTIPTVGGVSGSKSAAAAPDWDDVRSDISDASDPTEMFHRDFGTQTTESLPSSTTATSHLPLPLDGISSSSVATPATSSSPPKTPIEYQNECLVKLTAGVKGLTAGIVRGKESNGKISSEIESLGEDINKLTYPTTGSYGGGAYGIYGGYSAAFREPDDETKKLRDEIRRLKGVVLSVKTFPSPPTR